MLKIDLLKGQGIPIKSSPGGAFLLAVVIAIPLLTTMMLSTIYLDGRIELNTLRNEWGNIEDKISLLSTGVKFQESDRKEINSVNACFVEVHEVLQSHIQWTPIFVALFENLPEKLFLEKLSVDTHMEPAEVPKRSDPMEFITIDVPRSIMYIDLYGHIKDHDGEKVRNYIKKLNASTDLMEKIESVRPLSQRMDKHDEVVRYSIKCVFKQFSADVPL
jgi:hypothetical protein